MTKISKLTALSAVSALALTRDGESPPEQLTRELAFEVRAGSVDEKSRTVQLTFSSEEPYERWWGTEVLDHADGSVRIGRLNNGGALLMDHDSRDQVGVVERAWIEGRKAYAVVRFSKSARAQEVYEDVKDGIRKLVSVGYRILDLALEKSSDGLETYRATDWEPYEISLVAVPADPSVGVGRDGKPEGFDPRTLIEKEHDMRLARNAGGLPAPAPTPTPAAPALDASAERARVLDLQEMGRRLSIDQVVLDQAINEGWSRDRLAQQVRSRPGSPAIHTAEHIDRRDDFERAKGQFSLVNAIRDMVDGNKPTGREAEISQELARQRGAAPQGIYVPTGILAERTQLVGTAGIGGNLVGTEYRDRDFIVPLRSRSLVMAAGATVLTDLVGNAAMPRQTSVVAGQWVAEDATGTETDLTFDQVTLTPKTVKGGMSWSRQMALQALPAMEEIARRDLSEQLAIALDQAAINGPGTATQPRGVLNTAGIGGVVGGTNGAALTYSHLVDLESVVSNANADNGLLAYLTNSRVRGHAKKTPKFGASTEETIWEANDRLNRYQAYISNNVPSNLTKGTASGTCSAVIFGNWQDLVIGMWGALDLIVDPYSQSDRGRVRINAYLSADIAVRRAASFAAMVDALTPNS